jgi:hypothetical protein
MLRTCTVDADSYFQRRMVAFGRRELVFREK